MTRDRSRRWVLPVVSLGGMIGAGARFALEKAWPAADDAFPWAILGVNVSGCLLIGVLMVHVTEVGGAPVLLRPFLGVGVLGGYTTFSAYAVQTHALVVGGRGELAATYLFATLLAATIAVWVGVVAARASVRARRRPARRPQREERR